MGGEQAARVLLTVKLAQQPMNDAEQQAFMAPTLETFEREGSPYFSTSRIWDDGILDPVDTRDVLGLSIALSLGAPIPQTRFGVFRM
jgi:3-methylcrotonyl-CoA carboxylase beta subunit